MTATKPTTHETSSETPAARASEQAVPRRGRRIRTRLATSIGARTATFATVVLLLVAVDPAAAAQSTTQAFCNSALGEKLGQLFTLLEIAGVALALIAYKWNAIQGMLSTSAESRKQVKQHRANIKKSAAVLILIGPVYLLLANVLGLPGLECIPLGFG